MDVTENKAETDTFEAGTVEAEVIEPLSHYHEGRIIPNKHSDEVRLEVVRMAIEDGKRITQIAKEMGMSRNTVSAILREVEEDIKVDAKAQDLHLSNKLGDKLIELLGALTKEKLEKAWPKDIAVAFGVLADKRRDLLGPRSTPGAINLKFAFKDGSGALELTTGENQR